MWAQHNLTVCRVLGGERVCLAGSQFGGGETLSGSSSNGELVAVSCRGGPVEGGGVRGRWCGCMVFLGRAGIGDGLRKSTAGRRGAYPWWLQGCSGGVTGRVGTKMKICRDNGQLLSDSPRSTRLAGVMPLLVMGRLASCFNLCIVAVERGFLAFS